jgi:phosphotransacetylase
MPFSYRIDAAKRRVFTTGSGILTYKEAAELIRRMGLDPQFDPSFTELTDMTGVQDVVMKVEQIAELAGMRVFAPESRRAIVATNPLYFGMARMYESHHEASSGGNVRVFSDMAEAIQWIDGETPPAPAARRPRTGS